MSAYWLCVRDRFLQMAGLWLGVVALVFIAIAIDCVITGPAIGACILAAAALCGVAFAALLVPIFIVAMVMCAGEGQAPVAGALPEDFGLGMGCDTARADLDDARRELRRAREVWEDAAAEVRRARRRLEAALVAAGLSLGAIVGGIFNPAVLLGAIFASAAALALVERRGRALAEAVRREIEEHARVATLEAKVAALQALVNSLCPQFDFTPGDSDPGTGDPGVGTGTPGVGTTFSTT